MPCAFPPLYTQNKLISKVEKTCSRSTSVIDFRPFTSDNLNGIFFYASAVLKNVPGLWKIVLVLHGALCLRVFGKCFVFSWSPGADKEVLHIYVPLRPPIKNPSSLKPQHIWYTCFVSHPSFPEKIFFHLKHSFELFLIIYFPFSAISCSGWIGSTYQITGLWSVCFQDLWKNVEI